MTKERAAVPMATLSLVDLEPSAAVLRFFVGGIGMDATEPQLRAAFAAAGVGLKDVELVVNRATGFRRGFAYVSVDFPRTGPEISPNAVLERMEGVTVNARASSVRWINTHRRPAIENSREDNTMTPIVRRTHFLAGGRPVDHRDGAGHLDPTYEAALRTRVCEGARHIAEKAFVRGTPSADPNAEQWGEEFVMTVTSGEDGGESSLDEVSSEERGGPFVVTRARTEFAYDADDSNPVDGTREPFPTS